MSIQPKISIIVPVYNGEQYIEECLCSLSSQLIKNIEIIIIDDGSTDTTADLCSAYAAIDSRVRYHRKENGGVSKARNTGIEMASGDYLYFVDADDFVLNSGLKDLLRIAELDNSDIIIGDYIVLSNDKKQVIHHNPKNSTEGVLNSVLSGEYHSAFWNKLIHHRLFSTIRFPQEINYLEDFTTLLEILITTKPTVSFWNEPVYVYRQHPNAVTASGGSKLFNTFTALQFASQLLTQNTVGADATNALAKRIPQGVWSVLTSVNNDLLKEAIVRAQSHLSMMQHLRPNQSSGLKTGILLMALRLPQPMALIAVSAIRASVNAISPARLNKRRNVSAHFNQKK